MIVKNTALLPKVLLAVLVLFGVSACDKHDTANQNKDLELKKVKPLSTDASLIAAEVYQFLLNAEQTIPKLDIANRAQFDEQVFNPANTLLTRWRLEVKQSDSVAGDQFTICRGALISLDAWARSVLDQSSAASTKQEVFVNQKQLCGQALGDKAISGQKIDGQS